MSKKKKFLKKQLKEIFFNVNFIHSFFIKYNLNNFSYYFSNIFRITTSYKQLFFSLLNTTTSFFKIFSSGVALKKQVVLFKFFKKSIHAINPLVMTIRYSFVNFFTNLHTIECLNYSKKQYLFFKKFYKSIKCSLKYLIFKKTWAYTTQPVKRIKRRVVKLLKNI